MSPKTGMKAPYLGPKTRTPPGTLAKLGRAVGDATGVGPIARAALAGEKAVIDKLVEAARKAGVSEATIKKARDVKRKHDRLLVVASILFPYLPNPALLRLLAGESLDDLKEPKKAAKGAQAPQKRGAR